MSWITAGSSEAQEEYTHYHCRLCALAGGSEGSFCSGFLQC